ncbi:MAG: tetratricopeptide repeat protein [Planctomycetes bacterium]|nr:tetratricopeptide repeat protein [Planctomycetota bacterium]
MSAACRSPAPAPRPALGSTPPELARLLEAGEEAEAVADFDAAGEAYERATLEFPESAAAWSYYGEHLRFARNDAAGAEAAFRRALAARRADPRAQAFAWRGLGEIARGRGQFDEAIAGLERSLDVQPLADTHRSLSALLATERRDFAGAAAHAEKAVALDPGDPIALLQLAVQSLRAGKRERAAEAFRDAIRIAGCDERGAAGHPVHCCVLYNGACYHAVRGDADGALAMLRSFFATPNHRHITRAEILADPDFERLLGDAGFRALIDEYLTQ